MFAHQTRVPSLSLILVGFLAACGGGGGSGTSQTETGAPPPEAAPSVQARLDALGADTEKGPRLDDDGTPLPEGYSPLGARRRTNTKDSLAFVGWYEDARATSYSLFEMYPDPLDSSELVYSPERRSADPDLRSSTVKGTSPASRKAGCALDVDGDGRDEQLIAFLGGSAPTDHEIRLQIHPATASAAPAEEVLLRAEVSTIFDVVLAPADVDGDGIEELVVGYTTDLGAWIRIARFESGRPVLSQEARLLPARTPGATVLLEIEAGQLDRDPAIELVIVKNEYTWEPRKWYVPVGCSCIVWDDLTTDLALLLDEPLTVMGGAGLVTAFTADPGVGDIDADGMDEIVFGGIYRADEHCKGRYAVRVLDDLGHGLVQLSEAEVPAWVHKDGAGYDEPCDAYVYWVHVGVVDFEGDSAGEIHLNEIVYRDWLGNAPWTKWTEIPDWYPGYVSWLSEPDRIDPSNTAMVAGDYDGDGKEDLAVWAKRRGTVAIWGVSAFTQGAFGRLLDLGLGASNADDDEFVNPYPIMFPVGADDEGTLLEFVETMTVYTEPMVLAVIAAAPTIGRDQNLDATSSSYGTSESTGSSEATDVSFSAGLIVGSEFQLWGNGWDVEGQVKREWGSVYATSEQKTEGVSYSTGWSEDSVLCTVTTLDRYIYRVIAHPNPDAVGELVNMDVPRGAPQSFQVERSYYNTHVAGQDSRIGPEVLGHTIGDPYSYPDEAEKDRLVQNRKGVATASRSVGVGEAGATEVSLSLANDTTDSEFKSWGVELTVKTTVAAIKIGGTFSASKGSEWSWSSGSETAFSGTVGTIHPDAFAANGYQFGLVAYWHSDAGQGVGFQVVTFYVPR
jgi:hypothetical protein